MAWNWKLLRAGEFWLDAGAMLGIIPKGIWSRWLTPDEHNRMPLQTNCLLLEGHGTLALIEVGIGDKLDPKQRAIYRLQDRSILTALHEANCDPASIAHVIVTHLHFDHAAGLTRRTGDSSHAIAFPNARITVQKQEWLDAKANRSTMHRTYLPDHLGPDVHERLNLVEGEREVLPGVFVWPVPGHTWGQQAVRFADTRGRTVVYVPDVLATRYHAHPAATMAYDVESWTSQQEKRALLARAAKENWLLVLDHEHGTPTFHVRPDPATGEPALVEAAE